MKIYGRKDNKTNIIQKSTAFDIKTQDKKTVYVKSLLVLHFSPLQFLQQFNNKDVIYLPQLSPYSKRILDATFET